MSLSLQLNITASQTEIRVDGGVELPQSGVIQIESELIEYTSCSTNEIRGLSRGAGGSTAATHVKGKQVTLIGASAPQASSENVEISETYNDVHSHQSIAADLELGSSAGSDDGANPKFLAAIMGNTLGEELEREGNYVAGVIGAVSNTGIDSKYPTGALMGVVMDGVTNIDGAVVAVIDGSDPSAETRARAAFAVRQVNNNEDSGADFGLDLHDAGDETIMSSALPFSVSKADIRLTGEICILSGSGVPDATVGATFANRGSIYIRTSNGKMYLNAGDKTTPDWKLVTSA